MTAEAILALVSAIIVEAPQIEAGVLKAKALVEALLTAKLITAAQQDALNATIDARAELAKLGPPTWWTVQPDPQP